MKKLVFSCIILCLGLSTRLKAQDNCSAFYPLTQGAKHSYQLYDKKNRPSGTATYTVKALSNNGGNTQATMSTTIGGPKPKDRIQMEYKVTCTGDGVSIDYNSMVAPQLKAQMDQMNAEVDISGVNIEIPNKLTVGQELAEAQVLVSMNMSGINMNTTISTTDRKVAAKETISTPAGSFDCYVITATINSKAMMANYTFTEKIWLAKDVGMVRHETYNKKGKLDSKIELASFSR